MKGTIISIYPHIVKVERFEKEKPDWFKKDYSAGSRGLVEYEADRLEWACWLFIKSANWELPVHDESLWVYIENPVDAQYSPVEFKIGEPVTIKEIKNGKAILL